MSLSHDLQDLTADISAAIAANTPLARAKLEVLRRNLQAAAREAGKLEREGAAVAGAFGQLCTGVETQVVDLAGLARHARTLVPAVQ